MCRLRRGHRCMPVTECPSYIILADGGVASLRCAKTIELRHFTRKTLSFDNCQRSARVLAHTLQMKCPWTFSSLFELNSLSPSVLALDYAQRKLSAPIPSKQEASKGCVPWTMK